MTEINSVAIMFLLQYDTVSAAVKKTVEKFGKIDILVNSTYCTVPACLSEPSWLWPRFTKAAYLWVLQ